MNKLPARITQIEQEQNLHIVHFDAQGYGLKMMGLELPGKLHVGSRVILGVKPFHVAIGKNLSGELSYSNQIRARIGGIEKGKLLCNVTLKVGDVLVLQSFITLSSCLRMNLNVEDEVVLLMKASEVFIMEVVDDA